MISQDQMNKEEELTKKIRGRGRKLRTTNKEEGEAKRRKDT